MSLFVCVSFTNRYPVLVGFMRLRNILFGLPSHLNTMPSELHSRQ
jgi:hypothetical protein